MNNAFNNKLSQFERASEVAKLIEASGCAGDPFVEGAWRWSLSPLDNGRHAAKFRQFLADRLQPRIIAKQLEANELILPSGVPDDSALILGFDPSSGRPFPIHIDAITAHLLVFGTTGAGKTTFLAWLIGQLLLRNIRVVFHDHKGEGRRLLRLFPNSIVLRPDQGYCNPLEPVGPPELYWTALFAEFGRAINLHAETWSEAPSILERIHRGLRPGQPFPSLLDFVSILFKLAADEHRAKLITLARGIQSLCPILGKSAGMRKAPDVAGRYSLIIHEYGSLPPRFHRLLTAIRLLRSHAKGLSQGHEHNLKEVFVSDEGALEFGREFAGVAGSAFIPVHKQIVTQNRSFGIGLLAGAQMPSTIDDDVKSNVASLACLRCPHPREAKEIQQMLMLPDEAIPQIMSLPNGSMFVRSVGFSRATMAVFPRVDLGPYLSDREVTELLKSEFARLEADSVFAPAKPENSVPLDCSDILGEKTEPADPEASTVPDNTPVQFFSVHLAMLREIQSNAKASVTEHNRNLGWSAGRANRVKNQLIDMGLVEVERQKTTHGRPKEILVLADKGKSLLNENRPEKNQK